MGFFAVIGTHCVWDSLPEGMGAFSGPGLTTVAAPAILCAWLLEAWLQGRKKKEAYSLGWVEQAHSEAAGSDEVSGCDSTQERIESAARRGVNRPCERSEPARGSAASVSQRPPPYE